MPSWPLIPMTFPMGSFSHERLRALAGCRELKFRADGLRVIYRIRDGQVQIVDILAIGARDHDRAFRDAERRLGDEG